MNNNQSIRILFALCLLTTWGTNSSLHAQDPILNSIIEIVSPVEIPALIKELGIQYDKQLLNEPNNISAYTSNYQRALNLGIYSTDLGYANINEQPGDALAFLNSVKSTAESLNIGEFIDFNKILSLAVNRDNLNKLLEETSITFENIARHLQSQNQTDLAALILTGGWIETAHIICQVARRLPNNRDLTDRIIQQKLILNQLIPVLRKYQGDPKTANLIGDLENLSRLLDKYSFNNSGSVQTKAETIGGIEVVVVEDVQSSPDIEISPQEIDQISGLVAQIRNAIIQTR